MANPIALRKNTDIGAADAESDATFLENCFIDTGDVGSLLDCANPRCIVLGRTGVGKTALLQRIVKSAEHVAEVAPDALSLSYITNSNVLNFFEAAGVNLDVFYALLWRHILTVELLKLRFSITNQDRQIEFFERVRNLFSRDRAKQKALQYLSEWGNKFWEETEYRTKEFTRKLETDLKASVKSDSTFVNLGAEGAMRLSEEEKSDVRNRGTHVVNSVQVKELHDVIRLLSEDIFNDSKDKYYIVIDRLDEGWVEDRIRFKLIKALIETIRTFRQIHTVKIVVAIRTDLYYRVLSETSQHGFQEEKFRALYLQIRWSRAQLIKMLDDRVSFMFRRQYTRENVGLLDILPKNKIDLRDPADYILDRTFFRPREAIIYLNDCIARAEGKSRITTDLLRQAEVPYSRQRLQSLVEEWGREYPLLLTYTEILQGRETPFTIYSISSDEFGEFITSILEKIEYSRDPIFRICEEYYTGTSADYFPVLNTLVRALYQVGVVGIKPEPHLGRQWSFDDHPVLASGQLKPNSQIDVHKTFWAALGIDQRGRIAARGRS